MARFVLLTISVIVIILATSLQQAMALKCWECDYGCSDVRNLPPSMFRHCIGGLGDAPHCIAIESPTIGIRRKCARDLAAADSICNSVKESDATTSCKICDYDGCNGSSKFAPIAVMIALPMAIMKILSI